MSNKRHKQKINVVINSPNESKSSFVPDWLWWILISITVLAVLTISRQCGIQ